jgi:hypothetical protein
MLPSFSRGLRLALWLALGVGSVAWRGHSHAAYAKGSDDDQGGGDDDEDKGDDKGDEDQPEDDKDQPPVTAGGLFTMQTYPVNELLRPMTITQNIAQVRLGLGTDVSAKGAFGSAGVSVEGLYGVTDNFEVVGGFTSAYNFKQFGVYAGFEGAVVYDMLDIRLAANLHRTAIARYCNTDPSVDCGVAAGEAAPNIPNGQYDAGGTKFSLDLGFPFRYDFKPEIAIIALQTLMSIDFNQAKDRPRFDDMGTSIPGSFGENKVTPDLNPSIGIATNPIPQLSAVVYAQLRIPDFDTSKGNFQVPVTARVEVSPNQKFDVGLEFTLLNVMPPESQGAFDNRFVSLFVQSRFGK